jgi:hypothetical protein
MRCTFTNGSSDLDAGSLASASGRDARFSIDERGDDLPGRSTKRQWRTISKAVGVKVSHELPKCKTRIPSSRPFRQIEQRMRGSLPPHLHSLPEQ